MEVHQDRRIRWSKNYVYSVVGMDRNAGEKLSCIYMDTCCKWAEKLASVFPNIPVKLDLCHAVQRLSSTISKRTKLYGEIVRTYPLVFWDPSDLAEQIKPETHSARSPNGELKKVWKRI